MLDQKTTDNRLYVVPTLWLSVPAPSSAHILKCVYKIYESQFSIYADEGEDRVITYCVFQVGEYLILIPRKQYSNIYIVQTAYDLYVIALFVADT